MDFTRPTIVAANEFIATLARTHTQINKIVLRLGLRQGVLAKDDRGHRWLLHQGRLHPRGMRITEDKFDAVVTARRVKVRCADGTVAGCHPVTDLDQPADQEQSDVAAFIDL